MRPQVADNVHYVSIGTADGQYPAQCNAATITRVGDETEPYTVDLYVLIAAQTPPQHGRGGNYHDADINYCQRPTEGTWHYKHDQDHWTTPRSGQVPA